MTTGATLYLVSACSTPDELVAAFRRYADRTGVFIPTSTPLPAGRRGRVALTLANGGVMLEGEADIVQSSAKPTVLQGRPGMTVKFISLDEPSKTVLAELEKARLALKPAPSSVPPRPADIPAEPRATPPPTGGRIDAANALAECVVIGDIDGALSPSPAPAVPAIPALAPARSGTPSTPPPAGAPRTKPMTIPPIGSGGIPSPTSASSTGPTTPTSRPRTTSSKPTSVGMPIIDKVPAQSPALARVHTEEETTMIGEVPPKPAAPEEKTPDPSGGVPRRTQAFETQPVSIGRVAPASTDATKRPPATPTGQGRPPTRPPMPRHPTPVAPVPIVRPPAKRTAVDDAFVENAIVEEEKTDLNETPSPPPISGERTAVTPPPIAPSSETAATVDKPGRSGGMRASEIMAAIPTGDWTMAPDAPEPTALAVPTAEPPKGPPTGNWAISLDPDTGWSEPKKIETPPAPPPPVRTRPVSGGNPTISVAKDEGFVAVSMEDKPTHLGDKIEIDAALMGEVEAAAAAPPPPRAAAAPLQVAPVSDAPSNGVALVGFPEHADYSGSAAIPRRKKQPAWLFPLGAVAALGAGFGLVMLLSGSKHRSSAPKAPTPAITKTATPTVPAPVVVAPVTVDAAVEAVAPDVPAPPAPTTGGTCKVAVSSTPSGANVFLGEDKLGTTPADVELPCGVEARLSIRKASFASATRAFTPVDGKNNKVAIKLAKPTLTVKVMSSPPGATITVGGKSLGVTPATVRLPANEAADLVLTKPGFAVTHTTVTPKTNNSSTNVTLKKGRR